MKKWGRTVTVTRKRLTPEEESALSKMGIETPQLFRLRCDFVSEDGKACNYRPEGWYEDIVAKGIRHTHEKVTIESRVKWGTLTGKSRPAIRFTD